MKALGLAFALALERRARVRNLLKTWAFCFEGRDERGHCLCGIVEPGGDPQIRKQDVACVKCLRTCAIITWASTEPFIYLGVFEHAGGHSNRSRGVPSERSSWVRGVQERPVPTPRPKCQWPKPHRCGVVMLRLPLRGVALRAKADPSACGPWDDSVWCWGVEVSRHNTGSMGAQPYVKPSPSSVNRNHANERPLARRQVRSLLGCRCGRAFLETRA